MTSDLLTLYAASGAAMFGISEEQFASMLSAECTELSEASEHDRHARCPSPRLRDLVLIRACLAGNETAWNALVQRYRPKLFSMALQIAKEESVARELADSLFAELFGIREKPDGSRVSKLAYYNGRASLDTWMRAVLAQAYADRWRASRRLVPLDNLDTVAVCGPEQANEDPLVAQALDSALLQLNAEQRFLLVAYYLDGRSKAEIGRMCAMHQTTVGRRIDKALKAVRNATIKRLQQDGLSRAGALEALKCDVSALEIDVRNRLLLTRQA